MLDLTVVEYGDSIAAAAAGAMLAELGARVIKVEPEAPQGHRLRRDRTESSRLMELLDQMKEKVNTGAGSLQSRLDRLPKSDITILDITSLDLDAERMSIPAYCDGVRHANRGTWVTLSPFGLTGPYASFHGSELTYLASGGLLHYCPYRRDPGKRPVKPAGYQASFVFGHISALAALCGFWKRCQSGVANHLEVSAQEAVMATGVALECAHELFGCPGGAGMVRYAPPRGIVPCADGWIYVLALDARHWEGCKACIGDPFELRNVNSGSDRVAAAEAIEYEFGKWALGRTVAECVASLQSYGVPASPVNSPASMLADEGMWQRDFFGSKGNDHSIPRRPARLSFRNLELQGSLTKPSHRPRILDITHVLAGPLATSWLGSMGMDVVHLEDPHWPDLYRRNGPFAEGEVDAEKSAYFAAANFSKRSYGLPLKNRTAQLHRLLGASDLVVENVGVRRADALGLTHMALAKAKLRTDLVSCSGFGRGSPYSSYRVFGANIHAAGGLIFLSRAEDGAMFNVGTSLGDPIAAVWLAACAMAAILANDNRGIILDVAMVEAQAYQFPEYFSWLARDGAERTSEGNRLGGFAPHGVYRCQGHDEWLAIAISSDSQWQSFVHALGQPASLAAHTFLKHDDRAIHAPRLDKEIEQALAGRGVNDLFLTLQGVGVPCAPVWSASSLIENEHVGERGTLADVEHPHWGNRRIMGVPWRFAGERPVPIRSAPLLGEHTEAIDREWAQSGSEQ